MLLYPRVILIFPSLYLKIIWQVKQLCGSQMKEQPDMEMSYRSWSLNRLSISKGYPNGPPIIAASSIVTSYVSSPDFLPQIKLMFMANRGPNYKWEHIVNYMIGELTQKYQSWKISVQATYPLETSFAHS